MDKKFDISLQWLNIPPIISLSFPLLYRHRVFQQAELYGLCGEKRLSKRGLLDLLVDLTGYHRGHNSVTEVSFQVSQDLPEQPVPVKQQIGAEYLRALIERDPRCTLNQLCDWVGEERSITISKTAMCRLVKGYNLQRQRSYRPHQLAKTIRTHQFGASRKYKGQRSSRLDQDLVPTFINEPLTVGCHVTKVQFGATNV